MKIVSIPLLIACLTLTGCSLFPESGEDKKTPSDLTMGVYPQTYEGEEKAIEWNLIYRSPTENKGLFITRYVLDAKAFDDNDSWNYKDSSIRAWLNGEFYENAFSEKEKDKILTTLVDNSASSTGDSENTHYCENTNDKIFLLSHQEVITLFESEESRIAQGTDYAFSHGLDWSTGYFYSSWWLRSPSTIDSDPFDSVQGIRYDGLFRNCNASMTVLFGVRPACWVDLSK